MESSEILTYVWEKAILISGIWLLRQGARLKI